MVFTIGMIGFAAIPYSYAACAATILPQPCFDSFMMDHGGLTEKSIMENYARNIEMNYGDWQMSDRKWENHMEELELPAIICTEFVVDGITEYRMAKWVDANKISSFEDHRNDFLCDRWLAPIDDGIKLKWDKELYSSDDIAQIQVIDKDMNLDPTLIDSFEIHVFSDIDRTGIQLTVTETEPNAGYFYGNVILTTLEESNGDKLLVEDAVHVRYKENYTFSKIINETIPEFTDEDAFPGPSPPDSTLTHLENNRFPLGKGLFIDFTFLLVMISVGIIGTVFVIWRKSK